MAREVINPVEEGGASGPGAGRSILSFLKELPVLIALALVIALVIKAFLVQAFYIPSASMEPTLHVGDRVLVNKLTYRFSEPERGDLIVFKDPTIELECPSDPPPEAVLPEHCTTSLASRGWGWFAELFGLPTGHTKDYIKRIVALPGETIEMREGDVYIDGVLVDFPSTPDQGPQEDSHMMAPYQVPGDAYYVLGDNRANSSDSRYFSEIERDKIVGKAFVLLWPPNRFSAF